MLQAMGLRPIDLLNGATSPQSKPYLLRGFSMSDAADEIWLPVPDYKGLYTVSSYGKVFSIRAGRTLKPAKDPKGYLGVSLCNSGHEKTYKVHRIVMNAFVGPSPLHIDHINCDPADNRLENLQYATVRQNTTFGYERRGRLLPCGVHLDCINSPTPYRAQIRIDGKSKRVGNYATVEEASAAYQNALRLALEKARV